MYPCLNLLFKPITTENQNTKTARREEQRICKEPENNWQNGNKCMPTDNYFKYKCLNYPIKRHRVTKGIKNKIQGGAASKRYTLTLRTHIGWKLGMQKDSPRKW